MATTNIDEIIDGTALHRPSTSAGIAGAVTTGIVSVLMTLSGILYVVGPRFILAALGPLGYPVYFLKLLGIAKISGAVGLLVPHRPTLREWAYAGFTFDLVGAIVSHLVSGDALHAMPAAVVLLLLISSYILRRRAAVEAI